MFENNGVIFFSTSILSLPCHQLVYTLMKLFRDIRAQGRMSRYIARPCGQSWFLPNIADPPLSGIRRAQGTAIEGLQCGSLVTRPCWIPLALLGKVRLLAGFPEAKHAASYASSPFFFPFLFISCLSVVLLIPSNIFFYLSSFLTTLCPFFTF